MERVASVQQTMGGAAQDAHSLVNSCKPLFPRYRHPICTTTDCSIIFPSLALLGDGATSIVEMLFCTSLVALVGAGDRPNSSTRRLQIVNTKVSLQVMNAYTRDRHLIMVLAHSENQRSVN